MASEISPRIGTSVRASAGCGYAPVAENNLWVCGYTVDCFWIVAPCLCVPHSVLFRFVAVSACVYVVSV